MKFDVSVILPTCGRPDKLRQCLQALASQRVPHDIHFETIVAIDGGSYDQAVLKGVAPPETRFLSLPRVGVSAARNAALEVARGRLCIFTNDDTYPAPDWIAEHLRAHSLRSTPGMVIGRTEWREWPDTTVFDALLRDTSMIFFYDRMKSGETYGFRHFWTCNASIPRSMAVEVSGFDERLRPVFYEDVEFAYRVEANGHEGVYFHDAAVNTHDHRLDWEDYCRRERALGAMAARLAQVNLECFATIFGADYPSGLAASYEAWLAHDCNDHQAIEQQLRPLLAEKMERIHDWPSIRQSLYLLHLPLKRRCFRSAFVEHSKQLNSKSSSATITPKDAWLLSTSCR